uniref:MCRS_N domain-containing protein n=1 Tax=Gongylonema pulchrum TaxID=637853 RepID=A0A183DMA4_9BILA
LLYDEATSSVAKKRIADLSVEAITAVQSRTVFTAEEERLLSTVPSTTCGNDFTPFKEILEKNKEVFHHARTPAVLQQHWLEMRNWDLLQDQKKPSSRVLDYAEIEQNLEWDDDEEDWQHTDIMEMRLYKRIALTDRTWQQWRKANSLFFYR